MSISDTHRPFYAYTTQILALVVSTVCPSVSSISHVPKFLFCLIILNYSFVLLMDHFCSFLFPQIQSIEMKRETIIRSLILYLGEKEEELFEYCMVMYDIFLFLKCPFLCYQLNNL